ncbi:MAG: hypothetical protein DRP35_03510 [Candidatus Zixiibacteriota bacterium]|nr:MAG: hypothetical protein DRP35_03510 [candidate division Zixibacteria bacterium]
MIKYLNGFLLLLLTICLTACAGGKKLSHPGIYSNNPKETTSATDENSKPATKETETKPVPIEIVSADTKEKKQEEKVDSVEGKVEENPNEKSEAEIKDTPSHFPIETYQITNDLDDSASAVDDFIWRQFELAEEYHAMGVLANREASWEEAQYYFEKSLSILANLDIEADSSLTPEAVKYTASLDNIVADYRVTLRSLGTLTDDVSISVLVERFGDMAGRFNIDTMQVFGGEVKKISYDLPIVMNDRVKKSIVYFQTVAKDAFYKYLRRSQKYKNLMLGTIRKHGLPEDLIYLSLVESGYNPDAYSWARAMGLWQFISSTGKIYGLKRSWWIDERKDPVKSTDAACRFLKDLYNQFGSWELAMAAYNGGPGRVRKTIKRQKTIDFWKMKLKRQTMDYVPLIMAATIIAKEPEKYGFTNIEFESEIEWDEVVISRCLDLKDVAKELGCSKKELKKLNPELLRNYTPPNTKKYVLKVPKGKKDKFYAAYDNMPSPQETSWVRHKIRKGETVSTIASRYGVSQYAIFEANNLKRRSRIYAGKEIIVPVPLDREYNKSTRNKKNYDNYTANKSMYVVRSGDTMWDIARAFGTSVSELRRNNYIERGSRIYVGQKLKIPSSAKNLKNKSYANSKKVYASTPLKSKSSNYTVRSGDTLWDIARKYGTTTGKIRRLNGLGRSSRIYPGQQLVVNSNSNSGYVVHKVRRGESLSRIARRYQTSITRIMANNGLTNPDQLAIGANLKIFTK